MKMIRLHSTHPFPDKRRPELVEDIAKRGMMCPLLVHNKVKTYEMETMLVVHGTNRYRALKELGWQYAPCIIVGTLPRELTAHAKELHSLHEVQTYLCEGKAHSTANRALRILQCTPAEAEEFTVINPEPYFDKPQG